jgi:hypothetical protein
MLSGIVRAGKLRVAWLEYLERKSLRMLFDGPLRWARNHSLFVYLDAHWNDDLPLAEELEIVFGACPNAIVMIDDFNVWVRLHRHYNSVGGGVDGFSTAPILADRSEADAE